ncbi:WGR domain protein [Leptospira weilii str. Ecochallenge]|uniref:WGR domain protein n=1 Tax=Leptospira weilii str. Ecochallenge TaxID=1049986 RepID=N1U1Z8_9LEPT|nr:WGR domain protein [Leptospira weilii str. Ecochallenge]
MKHQLIYQDATSNKFWNIEVTENSFTVTYGKIGTNGQTQTKSFDTEEKCLKEAQKLLSEKLKKGYQSSGETDIAVSTASPKSEEKKPTKNNTETSPTKNAESEQITDPSAANDVAVESKSETKNAKTQVRSAAISGNGAVVDKTPQTHSKNGIHSFEKKQLKEPVAKTLGLSEEDLRIKTSAAVPITPKEAPQPFDLKTRIEKLSTLKKEIIPGARIGRTKTFLCL